MIKKSLLLLFIAASLSPGLFRSGKNNDSPAKRDLEEESSISLQDRADLAMKQEFQLTKDPATGVVPRERLVAAYQYAQALRDQMKYEKAIPGMQWFERGPDNCGGRTRAIMVDPNDPARKSVFSAGVGGGLWKTSDITVTQPSWNAVNDFFANLAITTLAYDPNSTGTMYFGTGEAYYNEDAIPGDGIWKSTDGGTTWNQLAATTGGNFNFITKIVVLPANSAVFAATRSGLFKSADGGTTWTTVLGSGTGALTNSIADVEIAADGSVWAAAGIFSTDGVYKAPYSGTTTGNAGTFIKQNTGTNGFPTSGFQRIAFACSPSTANTVYALSQSSGTMGIFAIYKTTNGGTSWTVCGNPVDADGGIGNEFTRGQAWYDLACAVDPNNANTVLIGGIDLFKSVDGGTTWSQITHWYGGFGFQDVHADQHEILFEPGNSDTIYFGNDGGIWSTANGSTAIPTITGKNSSYNVTQFYACAMHPAANSNYFLAGAQDNGSHRFTSPGINSTTQVTGGDGCFVHIDQDQPQYQWTSYVYNTFYRSTDGGSTWTTVGFPGGSFVNPSGYDNTSNVMYAAVAAGQYLCWTDPQTGATSANITITGFGGGNITHVSCSQNTPNRVFFGLDNGNIVRVDNANTVASGSAGILVGAPVPYASVSCVAIENGNDNHLLVTYSNYGVVSVWESTNALSATPTFTNVEGNLPDMPVRWALFDPTNNEGALLATEVGVWSTDALSGTSTVWGPSNSGLANVRVDMLQFRASDSLIAAATHGRGLFTSDIFMTPHADFTASSTIDYTGKNIQFTDCSHHAGSWQWDFGDGNTSTAQNPSHAYSASGLFNITLIINGNPVYSTVKTSYIQIVPNRAVPYLISDGGSFDVNPLDFGSQTISGTPYQLGSSTIAGKNGTVSGANAWVSGLTATDYVSNSYSILYCPNYNLTTTGTYTLSFYAKYYCETGYDGFRMEYSLDKGITWNVLGSVSSTWYNYANTSSTTSFPVNEPYFTGNQSAAFRQYSLDLSSLVGNANVAFRFVFKSDASVNWNGVAIDNFELQGPSSNPLPVEFLYFKGQTFNHADELVWATASEINNAGFEVQRSTDGLAFEKIGFVNGAGTSTMEKDYTYVDNAIQEPLYYYRLRQMDYDGKQAFSNTIALSTTTADLSSGQAGELAISAIYPNPASSQFTVALNNDVSGNLLVELFDLSGKLCLSKTVDAFKGSLINIDIHDVTLKSGVYLVRINTGAKTLLAKILKE